MADLSITEERKKVIDFSKPYAVITIILAAPKSVVIKDYNDLNGKKVGPDAGDRQRHDDDAARQGRRDRAL